MGCFQTTVMARPTNVTPSSDMPSLEIMAYYDDAEICNPLGSRAKKHKLGKCVLPRSQVCALKCYNPFYLSALFYYTLGNISPKYRSSLQSIQLFAVLKSSHLQQYGCDKVLEPLMNDIKALEKVLQRPIRQSDENVIVFAFCFNIRRQG